MEQDNIYLKKTEITENFTFTGQGWGESTKKVRGIAGPAQIP